MEWRQSGCSMCLAMNDDVLTPGNRCTSNFEGRQPATTHIEIDLAGQSIRLTDGSLIGFKIDTFRKNALLLELDAIGRPCNAASRFASLNSRICWAIRGWVENQKPLTPTLSLQALQLPHAKGVIAFLEHQAIMLPRTLQPAGYPAPLEIVGRSTQHPIVGHQPATK